MFFYAAFPVGAEELYSKLEPHFASMQAALQVLQNHTEQDLEAMTRLVQSRLDQLAAFFNDYEPPSVNTSLLLHEFLQEQTELLDIAWVTVLNASSFLEPFLWVNASALT